MRIEQLDGSPFPEISDVVLDAPLDEYTSAKIIVSDYALYGNDSGHRNESFKPRTVSTYVRIRGGSPILVSRDAFVYERESSLDGMDLCRETKTSGWGDTVRTTVAVSYPTDSTLPKYLRGLKVSAEDDAGLLTEYFHSLSNGFLVSTVRTSFNGCEKDTYTKSFADAAYRLPLRDETLLAGSDAVIDWTDRSYDSQRRLRSVKYSDGTCETNAYSCCSLLWRQDREGRKVLRSAKTGNDHLYYAEEDVWLAELGNERWDMGNESGATGSGYRITQHFFDGLGRETNTVVCVGMVPGEAVESDFIQRRDADAQSGGKETSRTSRTSCEIKGEGGGVGEGGLMQRNGCSRSCKS